MRYHNKNLGKSPSDPDYDDTYDAEQDYEDFSTVLEEKEEYRRED